MLPWIRFYDCSKMGRNLKFSKVDANRKLNESFVKYETETNWSLVELTLRFWVLFKIVFSKLSLLGGSIQENYINGHGKGMEVTQIRDPRTSQVNVKCNGPDRGSLVLDKRTGTNADLNAHTVVNEPSSSWIPNSDMGMESKTYLIVSHKLLYESFRYLIMVFP